ncbi:MAG: Gfo/Idh/MocA family oxidoreductase [Deltaproteobacteria bacterium]|nr:Gfo/Idh/MocA family oxidoreductase [Deltaproteobacteria bacterium]
MNHLRTLLRLQSEGLCRLVGVQDESEQRLRDTAKEYGVKTFSDYRGMEEADAVDIVVPTYNHFNVAKAALLAGKDILVEKPLTQTLEEAKEIDRLKREASRIVMVGHLFRYNPAAEYARKLIAEKELGKVRFLRGRFMGFRFQEHDAGILATTAIHFVYLSNYLIGRTPTTVWAKTAHLLGTKLDDFSLIRLEYGSEFTIIESDYFTPGKWRTFDIIGTQGSLFVDLLNQQMAVHRKRHVRAGDRYEAYDGGVIHPELRFQEPLELEIRHFLECVRERSDPLTGTSDGIETLRIVEAAYESSRLDKTIVLD